MQIAFVHIWTRIPFHQSKSNQRDRVRVCVCVCLRERERECVWENVCVWGGEREWECVWENVCVWVRVCVRERDCLSGSFKLNSKSWLHFHLVKGFALEAFNKLSLEKTFLLPPLLAPSFPLSSLPLYSALSLCHNLIYAKYLLTLHFLPCSFYDYHLFLMTGGNNNFLSFLLFPSIVLSF